MNHYTSIFPGWSRDGSKIAFSSDRSGTAEIWMMDADGSNQTQITFDTPGGNFIPESSPDGTRIVYASQQNAVGYPEVWVMNACNASERSRDGSTVAFWLGFETQFGEVWAMNPDGTNKRKLTETTDPFNSDNPV